MAFNVNQFKSSIADFGKLRAHNYEVGVSIPNFMRNATLTSSDGTVTSVHKVAERLVFRIDQVNTPPSQLLSAEIARYGIGPTQKIPYNAYFPDISFSVLLDRKADFWHFWYDWTRYIFEYNGRETPGSRIPKLVSRYKEDYTSTMQIVLYDEFKEVVKRINLYDAFPSGIRDIPLSWNDQQDLLRIGVSISYSHFSVEQGGLNL